MDSTLHARKRPSGRPVLYRPRGKPLRLVAAIAVLMPPGAMAHTQVAGPHGGPVSESAGYHVELVGSGRQLSVYLADAHGAPLPTKGASGRALVFGGKGTEAAALSAEGSSRLAGEVPREVGPGDIVVVTATLANGQAIQARFLRN